MWSSSWKDKTLTVEFRQPFDMLAVAADEAETLVAAEPASRGEIGKWLPDPNGFANGALP